MQKIPLKLCTVWMLGLAVLLGSPGVSSALPKLRANSTYCDCGCQTFSKVTELAWEKVHSCSVNGMKCKGTNSAGEVEEGRLVFCQQCQTDKSGDLNGCQPAAQGGVEGTGLPGRPGAVEPSNPAPSFPQEKGSPIRRRGIEEVQVLPGPPPGVDDPSEPTTGEKGK